MGKYLGFILLLLVSSSSWAQNSAKEKQALALLKTYCPEGHHILKETLAAERRHSFGNMTITLGEQNGFAHYIRGSSRQDIVKSLNTVVHEMTHDYAARLVYPLLKQQNTSPEGTYGVIYTQKQENILVKHSPTFPSRELVKVIPKSLRTFRFGTYLDNDEKYLGTQQYGIYGLLDEFAAYYQGTKAAYDLYSYYQQESPQSPQDYLAYMSDFNGTYYAYLEFKFYILKYLIYAQSKKPAIYQGVINNEAFKKAFWAIDTLYAQLIADYQTRNTEIAEKLRKQGIAVEFGEEYTRIANTGVGSFKKTYDLLQNEMAKPAYQQQLKALKN